MTRRALLAAALTALLALVTGGPALGQAPVEVRIREAALAGDGATRLIVSVNGDAVTGTLQPDSFTVTEEGEPVGGIAVEPLLESRTRPVTVGLVMDVSGSTEGQPLADAKAAARSFVEQVVGRGIQVALIAFSGDGQVLSSPTDDRDRLFALIDGLQAGGETALYDAVSLAATELARVDAQRNIVVFSDGADTRSTTPLDGAVEAAASIDAPVTTVALVTEDFDKRALDSLAGRTAGRRLDVSDSAALASAFEQVAEQLASQYVLTYRSGRAGPPEISVAVSVDVGRSRYTDEIVVTNDRVAGPGDARPARLQQPLIGLFGGRLGLYTGVAAAFLGAALLLGVAFSAPLRGSRAEKVMRRGMSYYSAEGAKKRKARGGGDGLSVTGVSRAAVHLAERVPKPEGFEERLQQQIDRAGWPMRATEFLALQGGVALGLAVVAFALFMHLLVIPVGLVIGFFGPRAVLDRRVRSRAAAFLEQLPDTLQLLAGSLRAGYGLLQAIDTVVQEVPEPTSSEFARALTEARLGMPLEDALEAMAERLGSEDFRWVVLAINIQRQVGGNLAQLLETVANTLREREMVRRQIKTLSAEGRLSAVVLTALPIVLGIYMFLVNTDYIMLLFTRAMGLAMVAGATVMMVIGVLWMRKLIDIEV